MAPLDRPKLRPLSGRRIIHEGLEYVALEDSLGLFTGQVLIPLGLFQDIFRHLDGRKTLAEIQAMVQAETGRSISLGDLEAMADKLDRAMLTEGATYSAFVAHYTRQETRPSSQAGRSYPADDMALRADLSRYFASPSGAGLPSIPAPGRSGSIRGILCPHIDFGRGGSAYSHAYKALIERSDADVFVILGVAHQACRHRFALTRKDFETPFGSVMTDRKYVDRIASVAGDHLFEDELAHRTEHSIEFQVVFLQYLLGERRDFAIVPILVGSFHDLMLGGTDPIDDPEVSRMIRALRSAEAASGKKVAYIGGIDLCHVGPEFGDPSPVDDPTLGEVRDFDRAMLEHVASGDATGWFSEASRVDNRWRVCGLAATYTLLEAIGPARGRLLSYDQAVNPSRTCCVTFASVAFEPEPASDGR